MVIFGIIFVLVGIWQLAITWRTFTKLKTEGSKETSPFIMLSLSNSLLFAVVFFTVGVGSFFY